MSLTVLERPQGIGFGDCISASIDEDYAGYATVNTTTPHNLAEDDYVYITSNIEDYNGFWPIHFIDGYHFFLKNSDGTYIAYQVDASITYCPESFRHGWSCVHLPIVYKIKSNLYPTNQVDTERTVSSFTNDNGYINLNLSGSLGTFNELQFIKVSGAASNEVNGVFQVLDKISSSNVTINLAYDSSYSYSGATVILYYSNYNVIVKVYAGLNSSHRWASKKPYELAATLRFTPDSDNTVMFSISEILKSYITIDNNTLLATLPNNLNAFTQFYIEIAESYDQSDGYTITTFESDMVSDDEETILNSVSIAALNLWSENGTGEEWSDTTTPVVRLTTSGSGSQNSENKYLNHEFTKESVYRIDYSITVTAIVNPGNVHGRGMAIIIKDTAENILLTKTLVFNSGASVQNEIGSWTFVAPENAGRISIRASQTFVSATTDFQINSILLYLQEAEGFEGFACNSMLEFKNQNSGWMTEYINGKWLTNFERPVMFDGELFDISAIVNNDSSPFDILINGTITNFVNTNYGKGIYRIPLNPSDYTDDITLKLQVDGVDITDEITIEKNSECSNQSIYLTWLNALGGYDYWNFTAFKDHGVNIGNTTTIKKNIFPNWPRSYGANARTITRQASRESTKQIVVRSQNLTLVQLQAIEYIKSSIDVYIVNSRSDLRSVIVDSDSFVSYQEENKLYNISFTITYTDDIPSQRL